MASDDDDGDDSSALSLRLALIMSSNKSLGHSSDNDWQPEFLLLWSMSLSNDFLISFSNLQDILFFLVGKNL